MTKATKSMKGHKKWNLKIPWVWEHCYPGADKKAIKKKKYKKYSGTQNSETSLTKRCQYYIIKTFETTIKEYFSMRATLG